MNSLEGASTDMHHRMTLGWKLGLSFGAAAAAVALLTILSLAATNSLQDILHLAVDQTERQSDLIGEIRGEIGHMMAHAKRTQLDHSIARLEQGSKNEAGCGVCHGAGEQNSERSEAEALGQAVHANIQKLRPLLQAGEARTSLEAIAAGVTRWQQLYRRYLESATRDYTAAHDLLRDEMTPAAAQLETATTALAAQQRAFVDRAAAGERKNVQRMRGAVFTLIVFCLGVVMVGLVVTRSACSHLRHVVRRLREKAGETAEAAAQVLSSGRSVATGARDQSQALQQVSSSGRQIESTARENSGIANSVSEASHEVSERVTEANEKLAELLAAMHRITAASQKITGIVRLIDELAFQTNLLSINAAIEAARAGESGTGFGVVAEEIRGLAARSAEAAHNVGSLIENTVAAAHDGAARLNGVQEVFEAITKRALTVTDLSGVIRSGSSRQATEMEQITGRLRSIAGATDAAATSSNQSVAAGTALEREAQLLTEAVNELSRLVEG